MLGFWVVGGGLFGVHIVCAVWLVVVGGGGGCGGFWWLLVWGSCLCVMLCVVVVCVMLCVLWWVVYVCSLELFCGLVLDVVGVGLVDVLCFLGGCNT